MDGHPRTLFIQGTFVAAQLTLTEPAEFFRYLCAAVPAHAPWIAGTARKLPALSYLTQHRYYSRMEALQSLALPGPAPTHVVRLSLGSGSRLTGPAWIEPFPSTQLMALPNVHRFGSGIEYRTLDELVLRDEDVVVSELPDG